MFEYTGAIHIHSRYSDGSGSLRGIIKAARRARADFIVITDHNNMKIRKEGSSGWHDDILVIIGEEISPRYNHYMVIGIEKEVPPDEMSAQRNIDAVAEQGGLGFVAHPFCYHRPSPGWAWLDRLLKLDVTVYPWIRPRHRAGVLHHWTERTDIEDVGRAECDPQGRGHRDA